MYNYISHISCEEKDFPVHYAYPNRFEQFTTINLPAKMTLDNDILEKSNAAFDFRKEYELVNDTQIYNQYKYLSKSLEISPEEYQTVCSDMNEVARNLRLTLYYPKFNYMQSEEFQELFKTLSKKAKKSKRKNNKKGKQNDSEFEIEEEIIPITTTTTYTYDADGSDGENEPIFTIVEEMPVFKGGNDSMYVYIKEKLKYPDWELKEKIQGTVYVSFVVNKYGKTQNVKVLRSVADSKNFDSESIRIIEEMPKWTHGKQAGEAVSVQYTIPISFKLDD